MTRKMYFHSLIYMQLRFSNRSADCSLVEAWGLPPLSTTIGGEIEKPVGHNWLFLLVKTSASSLNSQGSG